MNTQVDAITKQQHDARLRDALKAIDVPSPATGGDERRAHERVPFRFTITAMWTDVVGKGHACNARGCNICFGGISMMLPEPLDREQVVTLILPEPDGDGRIMKSRTVYCRPVGSRFEAGMQFVRSESADDGDG